MQITRQYSTIDKEKIIAKRTFFVDHMEPLIFQYKDDLNIAPFYFYCQQNSTEEVIILQMIFTPTDKEDENFLKGGILNKSNIFHIKDRADHYLELTKDITNDNIYICNLDMYECADKPYFFCNAYKQLDNSAHLEMLDLFFDREIFIKYNIFVRDFINRNHVADIHFFTDVLRKPKFTTVEHIKLDASTARLDSDIVISHYTAGNGPELYKFNSLSNKLLGRKLKCLIGIEPYDALYMKDFVINDIIYEPHNECLYLVYRDFDYILKKIKSAKILRLYKDIYDKTDLIDPENIYEKEINNNEESNN